jgi:hypothetical protein
MNPTRKWWRLAVPAVCLAALVLTGPAWSQAGDKDKDKGKDAGEKDKGKGLPKPFDQITFEAGELEKTFKVLKVDVKGQNQGFLFFRWSMVAKQKISPEMLNTLLNKTEVRFYAEDIIVGRYRLQLDNPEQVQRGLVQDEKMIVQLQLTPEAAQKLADEKPSRAALVKID